MLVEKKIEIELCPSPLNGMWTSCVLQDPGHNKCQYNSGEKMQKNLTASFITVEEFSEKKLMLINNTWDSVS